MAPIVVADAPPQILIFACALNRDCVMMPMRAMAPPGSVSRREGPSSLEAMRSRMFLPVATQQLGHRLSTRRWPLSFLGGALSLIMLAATLRLDRDRFIGRGSPRKSLSPSHRLPSL